MTSLQKQLAAIATSSTHQLDLKAQRAAHGKSLLFEPKIAVSQSFDTLYLICYEGYRDLCALDPRFLPFAKTLFSEQSKSENRTQMTKKENKELDSVLEAFITLSGPRLLLKPAEKALEWLVRRFRIHEYNTECLVLTYLPYHTTPQFLALLSILPPKPPPALRFLFPYITSPTNPPRKTIVYTAINTPSFFVALQGYVVKVLEAGHQGSNLLSFWSSITTQAVDGVLEQSQSGRREIQGQRTEELLFRVLPALNECLKVSTVPEALLGCYMIIIVLVTKGAFEDKVLDTLMEAVIRSQELETFEGCLMCLAIIAEEKSHVTIPQSVTRGLLMIPNVAQNLELLSKSCRIERLALGCALGALDTIEKSIRPEESRSFCQGVASLNLLDDSRLSIFLSALVRLLNNTGAGYPRHGRLLELVTELSEQSTISRLLETVAKNKGVDLEALGLSFQHTANLAETLDLDSDEDMHDAEQDSESSDDASAVAIPSITVPSFLDGSSSESFQAIFPVFEQAAPTETHLRQFLGSANLKREDSSSQPLLLTFLIRTWCSHATILVKVAAIRSAARLIKEFDDGIDLQNLVPYLICALGDLAPAVRRAAATCLRILSTKALVAAKASNHRIWAGDSIYGKESSKISPLSQGQTSKILSSVLTPVLEEYVMDPTFITASVKSRLKKNDQGHNLKSSLRTSFISFLASHAACTPLLRARLRLFPLFTVIGKSTNSARTSILLPAVRVWCSLSSAETERKCRLERLEREEADQGYLATLMAREPESMELLRDILSASINKERRELQDAGFERLMALWPSMKADAQLVIGESLFDLSLKENCSNSAEEWGKTRSLEVLRSVKLSTALLQRFIERVPPAVQMPEGPPAKKRRRTSRNEMARVELQSSEDISRVLRQLTVVLEFIESSNPGEHISLFKNLFTILGDLQQLKQQSGSDLVYLQSLVLSSLSPMVSQLKEMKDSSEYQSCVRADLLIDCIRHSTSPQVQNGALLLIASLASWVPALILHNLMPIFTFIGSTLLRQKDDYSAHVVDQTISRVVPRLAASLKTKHRDFLTGVADLLLSFTAAFEHIPPHRRLKLFTELAQTLGPQDSLAAIVALLVDRYPTSSSQRKFTPELLLRFEPVVTLEMFRGYLSLVEAAVSDKLKTSDLFGLKEKTAAQIDNTINHLLSALADLATNKSVQSHMSKAFRKSKDSSKPQAIFASIVKTIIELPRQAGSNQRLYETCSHVLARCLDALPTVDLIKSAELLLSNSDSPVKVAVIKSVEVRAGSVTQNDEQSVLSLLSFIPQIDKLLQQPNDVDVIIIAISCSDRIVERFGKKDTASVSGIAHTVSNILANTDDRVRILSLLCLTSIVDVLEEETIGLLPTVLPAAFEYLKDSIEHRKDGLHNAVFSLLSDVVERLSFIFLRDYLMTALELAQSSAGGDLGEACDQSRRQFYQSVSKHLDAKEVFGAIQATWSSAISQGPEAMQEQLGLARSTIENQSKTKIIQASSILFNFLLDAFNLRHSIRSRQSEGNIDEGEVRELENLLIDSVIAMTLKLNDTTFRPFFVRLVDLVSSQGEEDDQRSITFFKFLAAFFDRFKSIVTSYSSYIIDHTSQLLSNTTFQVSSSLLTAILTALQSSFAHDQDSFWQSPAHFSAILSPLLAQLTTGSATAVSNCVIPAITELAAASSSSTENHRDINAILLKYMRSEDANTRLTTVQCEQSLTKRLGEEWLALLPEMLPFISELREDDDEMVERETQRWITTMEEILGEDLEGMLQ